MVRLIHGDCLEKMRELPECSVDAICTDPPAGINFMNKSFDSDRGGRKQWVAWLTEIMAEALRVAKPGAHAFVWALPRTSHWTAWALEDAGWEIRDVVHHLQGAGFPKSLNVQKAAQKADLACKCETPMLQSTIDESLPTLRQTTRTDAPKPRSEVLLDDMHGLSSSERTADEDMRTVRQGMAAEKSGASTAKRNMFSNMCRNESSQDMEAAKEASTRMPGVRRNLRTEEQHGGFAGEVLQQGMLRQVAQQQSRDSGTSQKHSEQQPRQEAAFQGNEVREKPGMEGRSNLQAGQGELQGAEVRALSGGIPADGAQGRLHHGASTCDGEALEAAPGTDGSGTSYRPRSETQRDRESPALQQQWGTQTCGRCGKAALPPGLGTALKPAVENWILCRKPLSESSVSRNVLKHGTGGLNIDASRINHDASVDTTRQQRQQASTSGMRGIDVDNVKKCAYKDDHVQPLYAESGRWPANLILSHVGGPEGCQRVGVKRVRASSAGENKERPYGSERTWNTSNTPPQEGTWYADPDGFETIEAWECARDEAGNYICPVALLDEQSGTLKARGNKNPTKRDSGSWFGAEGESGPVDPGASGGASRFFKTFEGEQPSGRWPANVILSHHPDCQRVGVKRVRGINGGDQTKGPYTSETTWNTSSTAPSKRQGYSDTDGFETIEAWECVENCPVRLLDEQSGECKTGGPGFTKKNNNSVAYSGPASSQDRHTTGYDDTTSGASRFFKTFEGEHEHTGVSSASPCVDSSSGSGAMEDVEVNLEGEPGFFYCAKSSRRERNAGLEGMPEHEGPHHLDGGPWEENKTAKNRKQERRPRQNNHPTVKPLALMRYLVKLVTPPGGTCLDCFMGSGTTGMAAKLEGFDFIGIEAEQDYLEIARRRISHAATSSLELPAQPASLQPAAPLAREKPKRQKKSKQSAGNLQQTLDLFREPGEVETA